MKIAVNKNYIWSKYFVDQLHKVGVKHICISPGSRNTPLTTAFAENKSFIIYSIVDERSCGFFALGLSKSTNKPVAIVTTSGTAVAEVYPAIIEAYYSRTQLIVCTADRPYYLQDRGANQTINQNNIYKNHIKYFGDCGLPELNLKFFVNLKNKIDTGFSICTIKNRGPIHFNFQFEKPLEKNSYTNEIDGELLKKINCISSKMQKETTQKEKIKNIFKHINPKSKGYIFCGSYNYTKQEIESIVSFSNTCNYPIIADGASQLRFIKNKKYILRNYNSLIKSNKFIANLAPEIIIQFGSTPTSTTLLEYFEKCNSIKIVVNKNGDRLDPSNTAKYYFKYEIKGFINQAEKWFINKNKVWFKKINELETEIEKEKTEFFKNQNISIEGTIPLILNKLNQNNVNIFISNSSPIRDVDYFFGKSENKYSIFTNRGASGIDGINSTAIGVAAGSNKKTILVTGDLSFYHDLNGLQNSIKYKIPITIILINNNGGGLFNELPVARYKNIFNKYFITPINLDFKKVVEGYGAKYYKAKNEIDLIQKINSTIKQNQTSVIEIKTNSIKSRLVRMDYWKHISKFVDSKINEAENR
ncbi:MAG: 2-succinyl-5-enolpyruvyl-6-hydroxy-3-cyclohexene-1-carboxylic-acid synthase [Bacteroidetes bacterium]|nr:2-succinyl-5-enolpyruvyl-6-hydroxy-3-cyclohexene-1-carboxylic-acid synthase [Bacteroidota bacterium]